MLYHGTAQLCLTPAPVQLRRATLLPAAAPVRPTVISNEMSAVGRVVFAILVVRTQCPIGIHSVRLELQLASLTLMFDYCSIFVLIQDVFDVMHFRIHFALKPSHSALKFLVLRVPMADGELQQQRRWPMAAAAASRAAEQR